MKQAMAAMARDDRRHGGDTPRQDHGETKKLGAGRRLSPAAERALAEAAERRAKAAGERAAPPTEIGGRDGPDPTRYGDWEKKGVISDF